MTFLRTVGRVLVNSSFTTDRRTGFRAMLGLDAAPVQWLRVERLLAAVGTWVKSSRAQRAPFIELWEEWGEGTGVGREGPGTALKVVWWCLSVQSCVTAVFIWLWTCRDWTLPVCVELCKLQADQKGRVSVDKMSTSVPDNHAVWENTIQRSLWREKCELEKLHFLQKCGVNACSWSVCWKLLKKLKRTWNSPKAEK